MQQVALPNNSSHMASERTDGHTGPGREPLEDSEDGSVVPFHEAALVHGSDPLWLEESVQGDAFPGQASTLRRHLELSGLL